MKFLVAVCVVGFWWDWRAAAFFAAGGLLVAIFTPSPLDRIPLTQYDDCGQ